MYEYAVEVEKVSFSYENTRVIKELSLKVKHGEHIGIVGDSGCGKSTMLKLLAGLYEPEGGRIVVGGACVPKKIREKIAFVMQHNCLFPLSIRDNITCGHEISEKRIWEVCQNAGISNWIENLPHGLDTNVGEQGGQVSGGQAQRIQIARALCKDAPVILLDEPTSALDKDSRQLVMQTLNEQMKNKTVIHITHHPETLDDSYCIFRMEGGRLLDA